MLFGHLHSTQPERETCPRKLGSIVGSSLRKMCGCREVSEIAVVVLQARRSEPPDVEHIAAESAGTRPV